MLYKTYGAAQRVYRALGTARPYLTASITELERKENRLLTQMPPTWRGTAAEIQLAQIQEELTIRQAQ